MLELALFLLSVAITAPAFGFASFGASLMMWAELLILAWGAIGVLALAFHDSIEERILHYA